MNASAPSRVGVHSLNHFTLAVPDLDQAAEFYSSFGLAVEQSGARLFLRASGSDHIWADIVQADRKRLEAVRFGIYQDDVAHFRKQLAPVSIAAPHRASDEAIWTMTPDGLAIELMVSAKTSPNQKAEFNLPPRFSDLRGTGPRSEASIVRPKRLAHLALFTSSVSNSISFFSTYLGLRLSDRSGDDVAFMHGPHGSEHHMIALAKSDGFGLHHCSWEVGSIADVGLGAMQMEKAGYPDGWGLGRHVLGSNYFYYARDPWGSYSEYSADMDYIPVNSGWVSSDTAPEDSFYQWGPPPPDDFGVNYETV